MEEVPLRWSAEKLQALRTRELTRFGIVEGEVENFITEGLKNNTLSQLRADVGTFWYGLRGEKVHTGAEIAEKLGRPESRVRVEINQLVRSIFNENKSKRGEV